MVNTGRPSRGCTSCKERKVKCDEQKPSCSRCIRLKITCAGYADSWTLSLRQQDAHVAELVRRRVQKAQRRRAEDPNPVVQTLQISPEASSLPRFFHDYCSRSGITFLECLADSYSSGSGSCLPYAIDATALASLSRQQHQTDLMADARTSYGKAITGLREAIHQQSLVKDDSVLITLFVLGMFQTVADEFSFQKSPTSEPGCQPHAQGALALLRYRAEHRLATSLDQGLLVFFRHIRLMELLMTPDRIPTLWYELDTFVNTLPDGPILEPLLRRAAEFRITFMAHELSPFNDRDTQSSGIAAQELINRGLALAQDLQNAADALTHRHGTRSHPSSSFGGYITISSATNIDIASCL
ncbi:hypothetical protein B0T11DRAFT_286256 [Plectosphaerella cucumerina]|uniref:Zn(2)-C6 fungal-type domain-containing protein n=1 Tax=Plectosphaerella cucumerina TaxID=40658 RepID=A0A8K0X3D6_9PEZI|nr:hypothetical protein B0T11DRAFT_286256 [Plectosphaerella cucumerina]